jgi:predicted NAD/FAD-binding protein
VDTGFLVFNERTYPHLIRVLLAELGVETAKSDMSFSVQVPGALGGSGGGRTLEWSGTNLSTVFAQRSNLVNPRFLGMLRDLLRFNKLCTRIAQAQADAALMQPLGDFLDQHRFGDAFRDWYFLPMMGCIWSCPTDQMLQFPVATMIRFCHNHGLIQVSNRPQWWTVPAARATMSTRSWRALPTSACARRCAHRARCRWRARSHATAGVEHFDKVVLATHSDQALALLAQPSAAERAVLGAIRYQPNRAVLHTDTSVLPTRRAAWAAWNYERAPAQRPRIGPRCACTT